jgi:AGCS family alanine or glycine:cation symporter
LGKVLATIFALMCIGGSLGGGNMYQANQSFAQVAGVLPFMASKGGAVAFGLILAFLVGVVIIGGIKRIGEVAAGLVPFMCILYIVCGACLLIVHADSLGSAVGTIVSEAFSWQAGAGGFFGALIQGFRRAAFSNEAGTGSAAIVHSAARTDEPVREGIVALLEPFIDTIIVCTITGLVIVVTGAHLQPDVGSGISMTSWAFSTVFPWFPPVLSLIAVLFAFSTMISWSYYGEQCWVRLFGLRTTLAYKGLFLLFVWLGAIFNASAVIDFGDAMILGMAFPNLVGVVLLSGRVKRELDTYLGKLKAGDLQRY